MRVVASMAKILGKIGENVENLHKHPKDLIFGRFDCFCTVFAITSPQFNPDRVKSGSNNLTETEYAALSPPSLCHGKLG